MKPEMAHGLRNIAKHVGPQWLLANSSSMGDMLYIYVPMHDTKGKVAT